MPILPLETNYFPNNPPPKDSQKNKWLYPYFRILGANIDIDGTAEGRYQGYFASISGAKSNHIFEFTTIIPTVTKENSKHHVYGKSVIGTLSSQSVKGSFDVAVAAATASVGVELKRNSFKARARGIDEAHWNKLRLLGGGMDASKINDLGQALAQSLNWCVSEAKDGNYEPAGVAEFKDSEWDYSRSVIFALDRIKKGKSFKEAKVLLNESISDVFFRKNFIGIDLVTVASMYHRLGIDDLRPTIQQQELARKIFNNFDECPGENNSRKPYYFEVAPFHYENGTIPALLRFSENDPNRIKVHKWPIQKTELGSPIGDIETEDLDFNAALRISSAGLVDLKGNANISIKRSGFTSIRPADGIANSIVIKEIYTAGFKVRLKIREANSKLDVAAISARSTLGTSDVEYEIEGLGINLSELITLPNFLAAAVGKFDVNTLNALGILYEEASNKLDNLMTSDSIQPMLTGVELDLGSHEIQSLIERERDKIIDTINRVKKIHGADTDVSDEIFYLNE